MRIQKNFCDLSRFLRVNAGLTCREKCHACKKHWGDTGTQFVNRGVGLEKVNGRTVEKVYYLCDTCTAEIESSGIGSLVNDCK